jgi:peroxiredoxin
MLLRWLSKNSPLWQHGRRGVRFFAGIIGFVFILLPVLASPESVGTGVKAPFFRVKSGTGEEVTLDSTRGRVITIVYETKDVVEKSRNLKRELNRCYDELSDDLRKSIVRLPVINCSSAFWPITEIWKSKLRENSAKEGLTLYGDWDGSMSSKYKMKDNETNVVIIDKKGMIRYFEQGKLGDDEIYRIKSLLTGLIYGE